MAITKVTTDVITDGAVTAPKLATDSVTADKLAANSVTAAKIAAGTLTDQVANNSITAAKIPNATALTLDGGVTIDNINIDGTTMALSSGDLTLDVAGRIDLSADDNGEVRLYDGSSMYGQFKDDDDRFKIQSLISNKDMMLVGNDDGSEVTALLLDMQDAGSATFNNKVHLGAAGVALLNVTAADGVMDEQYAARFQNNEATAGRNYGVFVAGGSNSSDESFSVRPSTNTSTVYFKVRGDGNVGIGTASPTSPLHISSATNRTLLLDYTAGSGGYTWASFKQSGTEKFRVFGDYTAGYLSFYNESQSAHQLTLASSGKVGIGTASVDHKLHVEEATANTACYVKVEAASWDAGIQLNNGNGAWEITNDYTGLGTTGALNFYGHSANRMTITSAGNVGIGTDDPDTGLHLYGTSNVSSGFTIEQVYGGSSKKFGFQPVYNDDRLDIWYNSNATSAMTIKDGGKVGIACTDPANQFNVRVGTNLRFGLWGDGTHVCIQGANDANSAQTPMRWDASHYFFNGGNFGIGTSSPDFKLQVNGNGTFGTDGVSADKILNAISDGGSTQQLGLYDTRADSSSRYSAVFHRVGTNGSMTWVGSISNASGSVSFNTTSDYRLKQNVDYTWDATTRLKSLKPCRFSWKNDETNILQDGFLAHEVSDYCPQAVMEEKDGEVMQSIDHSKLVPLLVKTIQELEARIKTLEDA